MSENFDIIVIGGGASGLMAAYGAAKTLADNDMKPSVLIIEKMPRPGRKIMITGKGRCNFTNMKDWESFVSHIRGNAALVRPAFLNFPPVKTLHFMEEHGCPSVVERGDRAFPASYKASDIVDALTSAASGAGARLLTGTAVREIRRTDDGRFLIDGKLSCQRLIIATGGLSYPTTGSTGDGFAWAREAGHSISQLFPSLTAIVPYGYKKTGTATSTDRLRGHIDRSTPMTEGGKALCGISLKNVGLSLSVGKDKVRTERGDLDFTDGGIEGPTGFQVSRDCVKALVNGAKASLDIDLKPAVTLAELTARAQRLWREICSDPRSKGQPPKHIHKVFLGKFLPWELIPAFLLWNPDLRPTKDSAKMARPDIPLLCKRLKEWSFPVAGFIGYERAVVTAGGVPASEVVAKTLESKKSQGLHFCGEVLDCDCDTGGYNLQCAFSTGLLAGQSAAKAVAQAPNAMTNDKIQQS